jgi:hypothetical protein
MKFRKIVRMQVILVGLGAVLLLAGSAHAQQDMDPTSFDVNPATPRVAKVATARTAQGPSAATKANSTDTVGESLWSGQETTQEADLARLTIVDATLVVILMTGVGLIVLYAMAATKRERRFGTPSQSPSYVSAAAATAHTEFATNA